MRAYRALLGCVAVGVLAGCTVVHAPSHRRAVPAASASRAVPAAATGVPTLAVAAGTPPEDAAASEATLLQRTFAPPPGARAVSVSPVPTSPLTASPAGATAHAREGQAITTSTWWVAPGSPAEVLAWSVTHLPAAYRTFSGETGGGIWSSVFSLPAVPSLFSARLLAVSATSAGHGQTAIRVDAYVNYSPPRPPGDTVPSAATVATVVETAYRFGGTPPKETEKVIGRATVTDPAAVRAIASYLNRLPVLPEGGACSGPVPGGGIVVTFSARAGGPAVGKASGGLGGCGFLSYAMPGHPPIGLGTGTDASGLLVEFNRATGLHWKFPPPSTP